jgi:hypothetical protein
MASHGEQLFRQVSGAGRCDNGSESAATWKYASGACGDTAANAKNRTWIQYEDEPFRLRIQIINDAGGDSNARMALRFSKNVGAWTRATTGSTVRVISTTHYTDEDDTTQQLGSGSFDTDNNGCDDDDGYANEALKTQTAGYENEYEFCLKLMSAAFVTGDTVDFRLYVDDSTAFGNGYDYEPNLIVASRFDGTVAEDMSAILASSALAETIGTVAESAANVAAMSGVKGAFASLSEDAANVLTTSGLAGIFATVDESSDLATVINGLAGALASIAESSDITVIVAGLATALAAISENSHYVSQQVGTTAGAVEVTAAIDLEVNSTQIAIANVLVDLGESVGFTSEQIATIGALCSLFSNIEATELPQAIATTVATLSEDTDFTSELISLVTVYITGYVAAGIEMKPQVDALAVMEPAVDAEIEIGPMVDATPKMGKN